MRYWLWVAVCVVSLGAGALRAQASVTLNTPVAIHELVLLAYEIDFSTATGPQWVEFTGVANAGEARATLIDVDGPFNGNTESWDAHSGSSFNLGMDAPFYTGVHMFVIATETRTGSTSANLSGTLSLPGLPAGAITSLGTVVLREERLELHSAFERGVMRLHEYSQPGITNYRFDVDYGATSQAAEIDFRVRGNGLNDVRLFEVTAAGTRQQIGQYDADPSGELEEWTVAQTSSRSGIVTFEVDVDVATAGGNVDWLATVSNNVRVVPIKERRQNFTATITDGIERMLRFRVDYGPTARTAKVRLSVSRVAGNEAVSVSLIDLDTSTETADFTADTVLVNTSGEFKAELITGQHTGVREFIVALKHNNLGATAATAMDGTLRVILPDSGGLSSEGTAEYDAAAAGPAVLFSRAALLHEGGLSAGVYSRAVRADFGGGGATDFSVFLQGQGVQSMSVYRVEGSNETLLFNQGGGTGNTVGTSALLNAPAGTGLVTLRVDVLALANANVEWSLFVPSEVTLSDAPTPRAPSPGAGSGGGGCLAAAGTGLAAWLLPVIAGVWWQRRRRARAAG
jgi:hypothetical protein